MEPRQPAVCLMGKRSAGKEQKEAPEEAGMRDVVFLNTVSGSIGSQSDLHPPVTARHMRAGARLDRWNSHLNTGHPKQYLQPRQGVATYEL